jgi:hypothetical protein
MTDGSGKRVLRCAIYTRVSTDQGLDQDFNSLDAQREASEAYIKSQAHEGSLLHGGLERRVGALRRYPSSDAHEFGLPELAHSVERFDRDGNLGGASGVVA